jgi:hypothetical protein
MTDKETFGGNKMVRIGQSEAHIFCLLLVNSYHRMIECPLFISLSYSI